MHGIASHLGNHVNFSRAILGFGIESRDPRAEAAALATRLSPGSSSRDPLRLIESQFVPYAFDNGVFMKCFLALCWGMLAWSPAAAAQHDYRNLDRGRPLSTEDAYPVEAGALEVMLPWSVERAARGSAVVLEPEVTWGILRNAMIGVGAPIVLGDDGGLAGLRPFAFYNFNTEGMIPGVAARLDVTTPVGALGGEQPIGMLTLILTRSWGTTRLHANGGLAIGRANGPLEDHPPNESVSVGIDHTLWRRSMVVMADVQRNSVDDASWWVVAAGMRVQATPTTVLDVGVQRRLSRIGPDLQVTAGFTRALSLRGGVE
jgi:hypothetical protein